LVNLVESGVLTQEWVDDYLISSQNLNKPKDQSNESTEINSSAAV
jgi:hypothetical protein